MKLALVTGAHGFIGRHLSLFLQQQGVQVCGIGHGIWPESEQEAWGIHYWLNGDVTKRNLNIAQSRMGRPDMVFHLAGGSSVNLSLLTPEEDFHRSVISTLELLEWARLAAPDTCLVLASSAAVYGAGHSRAIRETDPLAPYSPYGYHKRIAEELFESYGNNFNLNVAIVRLFSVYGKELSKQLLWDACGRLRKDVERLVLSGTGAEVRDWFHITDAVQLMLSVVESASRECFVINGGTGVPVTVRDIAEKLCTSWGMDTILEFSGVSRRGDPEYLVADTDKSALLGFQPQVRWEVGVARYVQWVKLLSLRNIT